MSITKEPKGRLGAGVRWLAIVLTMIASAELFTRIEDSLTWGAPLWGPYSESLLIMRDSFGIRGRPGYRFEKWGMNRHGFRGADITTTPAPGKIRVAVLGASESFGLFEAEGQEYPSRLRTILDSLAPDRFEVVNVSLAGLSPLSMASYFASVVAPIQPKVVVVYPSPSFYLEVEPLPQDAPRTGGTGAVPPAPIFRSRLSIRAQEVIKGLIPSALLRTLRERQLSRRRSAHPAEWVWDSVPADRMETFRHHLRRLVADIATSGATVVLVTHTNRYLGAPEAVSGKERRHLVDLMSRYYPRATAPVLAGVDLPANQVMRDVARSTGAAVVDAEGRIPPSPEFFGDYAHFTDAGADRMARLLAAAILSLPLARPAQ